MRDIDDETWADTEEQAYADEADYYFWKRQAAEELNDFEERLRLRARTSAHPLLLSAAPSWKKHRSGHDDDEGGKQPAAVVVVQPESGTEGLVPKDKGEAEGGVGNDNNAPPPPPP